LSTCTVTPSKIAAASGSASVTVTVTTTAAVLASSGHGGLVFAFCLPGLALLIPAGRVRRAGIGLILMTAVFASCGGGGLTGNSGTGSGGGSGAGLPGTAPGDYTIGVSATPSSGGTGHGAMLSLKVT
jgi:hypothetical protein